ncbi:MAG: hypothetical protein IT334_08445 [Thermomicrobiales bacterium]|nr:hypothetical protein [Thermomicrobiales bacterium]
MEFVILGIVLLLMLPVALLPFVSAAEETMEADLRNLRTPKPAPTQLKTPATLEPRQAA